MHAERGGGLRQCNESKRRPSEDSLKGVTWTCEDPEHPVTLRLVVVAVSLYSALEVPLFGIYRKEQLSQKLMRLTNFISRESDFNQIALPAPQATTIAARQVVRRQQTMKY